MNEPNLWVLFPRDDAADVSSMCQPLSEGNGKGSSIKGATILVPDGSWANATALVLKLDTQRLAQGMPPLRFVQLDKGLVSATFSPLIEALRAGCGLGRISTLEAIALFCNSLDDEVEHNATRTAEALLRNLDPLVRHVTAGKSNWRPLPSLRHRFVGEWTDAIVAEARVSLSDSSEVPPEGSAHRGVDLSTPLGLRQCVVCNAALSTPLRMRAHLEGRKHCEAVARRFLENSPVDSRPNSVTAASAFVEHSSRPIALSADSVEPPDVALDMVMRVLHELSSSTAALTV